MWKRKQSVSYTTAGYARCSTNESKQYILRAKVKRSMANAKSKGKRVGRPILTKEAIPDVLLKRLAAYREGKLNVSELARVCGVSRARVYGYLKMVR